MLYTERFDNDLSNYRKKTLEVLHAGGDIQDLTKITDMGMNLRIEAIKESVADILSKEIPSEEKAQLIAEKLVEV